MSGIPNILEFPLLELRGSSAKPGILIGLVPELALTQRTLEINPWHDYETTWAHIWAVVANVQDLCLDPDLASIVRELELKHLGGQSLLTLFTWANILHDIGKPATQEHLLHLVEGVWLEQSLYPGHEDKGAAMSKVILERLGFLPSAVEWVVYIVKWHGLMHGFFGKPEAEFCEKRDAWKAAHPHHWRELFLHSWADTIGGYHAVTDPAMYALRMQRYRTELTSV
jgi:hypothetical protein